MDYLPSSPKLRLQCLLECIGTFILTAALNFSPLYYKQTPDTSPTTKPQPILIFLSFYAAIQISRPISGGHLNPAVSLSIYMSTPLSHRKREHMESMQWYFISQITGAVCACVMSWLFYDGNIIALTVLDKSNSIWGFLVEMLATFVFCLLILCQGNAKAEIVNDEMVSSFVIMVALFGCCGIAGRITGGCLNPAIGFAVGVVRMLAKGSIREGKLVWMYVCGPGCGGVVAGVVYEKFYARFYNEVVNSGKGMLLINEVNVDRGGLILNN